MSRNGQQLSAHWVGMNNIFYVETKNPAANFLWAISNGLATGKFHIASTDKAATPPTVGDQTPKKLGWINGAPQGKVIGTWHKSKRAGEFFVLLDPKTSFARVMEHYVGILPPDQKPADLWEAIYREGLNAPYVSRRKRNGETVNASQIRLGTRAFNGVAVDYETLVTIKSPAPLFEFPPIPYFDPSAIENRLAHAHQVGLRAMELGRKLFGLKTTACRELFIVGKLHNIGPYLGARKDNVLPSTFEALKRSGLRLANLVGEMGKAHPIENSQELFVLNVADMQTSLAGHPVSFEQRLHELEELYGPNSHQHHQAQELIASLSKTLDAMCAWDVLEYNPEQ